ncbi:MAG TPA: hypothetical protein VNA88_06525 [Candidatus Kapabacteria bacterium]|jgi:hypothetical protein|nr:hypothetical protein [Candidatus Kapabacteria bacterium]
MSDSVSYRLANVEGLGLEGVDAALVQGARFVVFEYALSFGVMTWSSPSSAWLVRDEADARRVARRFTIPTAVLGWWCLPHGPEKTLRALRINRDGGVDVQLARWVVKQCDEIYRGGR